jgi:hypothetical protein
VVRAGSESRRRPVISWRIVGLHGGGSVQIL